MATCLQVPMVVPSTLRSSSTNSSSSSSSFDMNPKIGWRNVVVSKRRLNYRCSSSNFELPSVDLNDPLIKGLAAHIQANPEPSPNSQSPPFLDFFKNPTKSPASSSSGGGRGGSSGGGRDTHVAQARRRGTGRLYGHGIHKTRRPPPDLASILFEERIVFLGMPIVDLVSELIVAQFLYLQWVDDTAPIYLYINSTGTTREDDNQVVAHQGNALAIYDIMMQGKNPVETVCIGTCTGYACLLLAAGTFGRRAMLPRCRIAMQASPIPATGLIPASDVSTKTREAQMYRDQMFKYFAYHTGHCLDEIKDKLKNTWYMGAKEALEYGVIDKIIWNGQEDEMQDALDLTSEQWDKLHRGKTIYEP